MIQHTYTYLAAGMIMLFTGCSLWTGAPHKEVQFESTPDYSSKSLAGSYLDVGSDGSIKPRSESSGMPPQRPQGGETTGVITLGGPAPIPDLRTGEMVIKGGSKSTQPRAESSRDGGK